MKKNKEQKKKKNRKENKERERKRIEVITTVIEKNQRILIYQEIAAELLK